MSVREDCLIVRQVQEAARAAYLRRIDRELKRGPYADLYQCGLAVQAEIKAERRTHRLDIEIQEAIAWPHVRRYRAACSCGWKSGEAGTLRLQAERDLAHEREHLDRPLMAVLCHTEVSA